MRWISWARPSARPRTDSGGDPGVGSGGDLRRTSRARSRIQGVFLAAACVAVIAVVWVLLTPVTAEYPETPAGLPRVRAQYLMMRDGARIAVDAWLPADLGRGDRIPTVMRTTRYWRAIGYNEDSMLMKALVAFRFQEPLRDSNEAEADRFNEAGYALVLMDTRGSGASFGFRNSPWSRQDVDDYREVVDWIIDQPWSNGRVGAHGVSYDANTAELLAATGHPAVRAVIPRFPDFDPTFHLAMPGGVLNEAFLRAWSDTNQALDANDICAVAEADEDECSELRTSVRGVKPVDDDVLHVFLADAVKEHVDRNVVVFDAVSAMEFRDDAFGPWGATAADFSPYGFRFELEASAVPVFHWASWMDAGTAAGALARFMTLDTPQLAVIGAWSHGAGHDADPFRDPDAPVTPTREEQYARMIAFLDRFLKDEAVPRDDSGGSFGATLEAVASGRKVLRYVTAGSGEWNETDVWPPAGVQWDPWYLGSGATLSLAPATATGTDHYAVDFGATTGTTNRWHTQLGGGDVAYEDRSEADARLATWTSTPLEADMQVTGHPVFDVWISSTHQDGALHAYLESVAPDGAVTYLTEGLFRLVHREESAEGVPYHVFGPGHSFLRRDARPLVPGEVARIRFAMLPISVRIPAGHAVRLALAGADADNFARYPSEGTPLLTIWRGPEFPSAVVLPAMALEPS